MSEKSFDRIAAGLREALAIAKGEAQPAKLHLPADVDVKTIAQKQPAPRK